MAYTTIDDPTAYFQTKIYSGSSSAQALTFDGNSDMQPDWLWLKRRSAGGNHFAYDSVRGANRSLVPNDTDAEDTSGESTSYLTSFDSDGFTVAGGYNNTNNSGSTYVGWGWKKQAGVFDIQTYTGNGSARTISHNLGAVPTAMIIKKRNTTAPWSFGHASLGANQVLELDATDTVATDASYWNNTRPTSSVFSVGTDGNQNTDGHTYVIYLFGNKQGVSKMGSYTGNGNADGTFVYLGFKPAFFMVKRTDTTNDWQMHDSTRDTFNGVTQRLMANLSDAEATTGAFYDFTSTGVKCRNTDFSMNASGGTYIYLAFAENPFVNSGGVPTTAR